MTPKTTAPRKRAPGGGMKADDGVTDVSRNNLALDPAAEAIFLKIGNGNKSLGAREAARRLAESKDVAGFDPKRHAKRVK